MVPPIRSRLLNSSETKLRFVWGEKRACHGKSSSSRGNAVWTHTTRLSKVRIGVIPAGFTGLKKPGRFVAIIDFKNPKKVSCGLGLPGDSGTGDSSLLVSVMSYF